MTKSFFLSVVLCVYCSFIFCQDSIGLEIEGLNINLVGNSKIQGALNFKTEETSIFIGEESGALNEGIANTMVGHNSGRINDTGHSNAFFGYRTGFIKTSGFYNAFFGSASGENNSIGQRNTFIGFFTGKNNTTGSKNVFVGDGIGSLNISTHGNTFVGSSAGEKTAGTENTFLGALAGFEKISGAHNVFLGVRSGENNTSGSRNVFLGNWSGRNETGSDLLYIDNSETPDPLIWGNFTDGNEEIKINGKTTLRDLLVLTPQVPPVGACNSGEIVFGTDDELYVCKAGAWKQVMTN